MSKLDHPNCIKLFEVIEDEENEDDDEMFGEQPSDKLYMILELAKFKEIMSWDPQKNVFKPSVFLLQMSQSQQFIHQHLIVKIIKECLEGLQYLHKSMGIVHRDIKP